MSRFITWLRRSGMREYGLDILDSFNPFYGFIEHGEYPLARIYGKSLWTGITDAFNIFIGKHFNFYNDSFDHKDKKKTYHGILDVLIFPLISRRLFYHAMSVMDAADAVRTKKYRFLAMLLTVLFVLAPAFTIAVPLLMMRYLVGGLLALAVFPFILLVHGLTYFKAKKYQESIQTLELLSHEEGFHLKKSDKFLIKFDGFSYFTIEVSGAYSTNIYHIELNPKNAKGIEALLATNSGNILRVFEQPEDLHRVQKWAKNAQTWLLKNSDQEKRMAVVETMLYGLGVTKNRAADEDSDLDIEIKEEKPAPNVSTFEPISSSIPFDKSILTSSILLFAGLETPEMAKKIKNSFLNNEVEFGTNAP